MLEFYVNYVLNAEREPPRRMQAGPFKTAAIAEENRQKIIADPKIRYCFLGVSRDQTRHLVQDLSAHNLDLAVAAG